MHQQWWRLVPHLNPNICFEPHLEQKGVDIVNQSIAQFVEDDENQNQDALSKPSRWKNSPKGNSTASANDAGGRTLLRFWCCDGGNQPDDHHAW